MLRRLSWRQKGAEKKVVLDWLGSLLGAAGAVVNPKVQTCLRKLATRMSALCGQSTTAP